MKTNYGKTSNFKNLWKRATQPNFSSLVWEEHHQIVTIQESGTCRVFAKVENKDKNWSSFVPCWDHTRVILSSNNSEISNYIHANYVDGFNEKKKFICTQAPKMNTVKRFWDMVWKENSRIIIMLMSLMTNTNADYNHYDKHQCYPYWHHEENGTVKIGDYNITTMKKRSCPHLTMTELCLTKKISKKSREIYHYSYTDWTIDGIPASPSHFYEFIRKVNVLDVAVKQRLKIFSEKLGPIIVHCTTGIGRTGIFCTTDYALFEMLNTSRISLPEIVRSIRQQRHSSVIIPEQYFFCYRVILHFISIVKKKKAKTYSNQTLPPNNSEIDVASLIG